MNELVERQNFLPDTIEDLRDFILIGKERLKAQAAKIRAIMAIGMAGEAKKLAQDDAHDAGTWKINLGYYVSIATVCKAMIKQFPYLTGKWIPREKNFLADELSKAVLRNAGVEFRIQPEKR